jgi:hypothetical protein
LYCGLLQQALVTAVWSTGGMMARTEKYRQKAQNQQCSEVTLQYI